MKYRQVLYAFLGIVICQSVGTLGSIFTISEIPAWFQTLTLPSFQPPNWLFGPAWGILHTLMGIVGARIWIKTKKGDVLRRLFVEQLAINAIWTPVFFGLHSPIGGLVIIAGLDVLVGLLLWKLWKKDRKGFWLLSPYFAWILFATCLNTAILILNS